MKSIGYNSLTSWIALFAVTVISFFHSIIMRMAGFFFVVILDRYETDRFHASIFIVIFGVLRALTGPFVAYLGENIGYQTVYMIGCVVAPLSMGACFFAEDITAIITFLGVFYGLALSCSSNLTQTMLRMHFSKHTNFVNGVYSSGATLGCVIMTPVLEYIKQVYGVSGMFLIMSGLFLNCIPLGALLKHPHNERLESMDESKSSHSSIHPVVNSSSEYESNYYTNFTFNRKEEQSFHNALKEEITMKNSNGIIHDPELTKNDSKKNGGRFGKEELLFSGKDRLIKNCTKIVKNKNEKKEFSLSSNIILTKLVRKLSQETVIPQGFERNLRHATNVKESSKLVSKERKKWASFLLFKDPVFHLIMFNVSMHLFATTLNWTVLIDLSRDKGIPDNISLYFIMALPSSATFGSLCFAWITDRGFMTLANFNFMCFFLMTFMSVFIFHSTSFEVMLVVIIFYGTFSGAVAATFASVVFENIEKDKHNMALCSKLILYAFLCLTKSPLIGYFRGHLGSYAWVYYIMSSCLALCTIVSKLIPVLSSYMKNKKEQEEHCMKNMSTERH